MVVVVPPSSCHTYSGGGASASTIGGSFFDVRSSYRYSMRSCAAPGSRSMVATTMSSGRWVSRRWKNRKIWPQLLSLVDFDSPLEKETMRTS